jgi:hypothetical protein
MPARPRGKPFADMVDEDWKIETGTLARLRILLGQLQPGVVMDDVQFAELVAIRTAWGVRQ